MTTVVWPFDDDAKPDDPLTALRIPVVSNPYPQWKYVAAFVDVSEEKYGWRSAERPTDREAAILASFIEQYIDHWFNERHKAKLRERPLDVDSGNNTTIFIKYGPDDWGHRMASWQYGPTFVPIPPAARERHPDAIGRLTLEEVMNHRHSIGGEGQGSKHWVAWKSSHPDVFSEVTP